MCFHVFFCVFLFCLASFYLEQEKQAADLKMRGIKPRSQFHCVCVPDISAPMHTNPNR